LKVILSLFFVATVWLYALPADINTFIRKSKLPQKDVSIYIKEVGTNRVVASLNANTTRKPASVIKVMSTYAALLELGFDYRWPTQFYTSGKLSGGTLHGDLVVKGFGDPTLSKKDLPSIVKQIKAKGIRKITGNIIIDRSYFAVGNKNNSGFDKNTYSPYNAMPDAMMFNERVSTICITPNKNVVYKDVPDGSYVIKNNLQRVNKPCKGRYSWPGFRINNSTETPQVLLQGKISKSCGKRKICKVITKPYKSFYYALKDTLKKSGVTVQGTMRLGKVPSSATILFTHYSRPLEQIVSRTAKKSNNLYARHLLLYLGAKKYGAPATLAKGRKAVEYILKSKGALNGSGTLHIDNGSGLSRDSKMSAKMLAGMYENAYKRYGERWMKTLSIAGVDGTIKRRFRNTAAKNRAWMKTGTLNRVKNIGGYVKNRGGTLYTVVILVNTNQGRWKASKLQNDIIIWLSKTSKVPSSKEKRSAASKTKQKASIKTEKKSAKKTAEKSTHSKSVQSASGNYYIQTGVFSESPGKAYFSNIKKLGLPYRTQVTDQYKVFVGPYSNESQARVSLKIVRKNINSGAFLVTKYVPGSKSTLY
jgi:D-alanyl-D-alanine carboxypeptidase/D-alanyl-D-alanine-endopeptidase (penicillin-binding protein 4)